jgi:ABC-type glutathione transport system ATPase component
LADGIQLEGLEIRAGDRVVVHEAALTLAPGEIVGLVGASGSGKSLTVRALLGLVPLLPGVVSADLRIEVGGTVRRPYVGAPLGRRARNTAFAGIRGDLIGLVPQNAVAALDPTQRVRRVITESARLAHSPEPAHHWLEKVGLSDPDRVAELYPHELSGGMAQRVVLAAAFARRSRYLLADEPTTGLDPMATRHVLRLLRSAAREGVGVLFVTHDLRTLGLANRVVLMDHGVMVESMRAEQVRDGQLQTVAGRRLWDATRAVMQGRLQ